MDLRKPYKYKKDWIVFNDTTFNFMNNIDCDDTVNGVCLKDISLDKCIDECAKLKSSYGYYINGDSIGTVCVPIYTELHEDINPLYRLRNADYYPVLKNVNVTSFVNTKKHSFPPNDEHTIFYRDILTLKNVKTNFTIGPGPGETVDIGHIHMSKEEEGEHNIQITPVIFYTSKLEQHTPVKYGDYISIRLPGTTLTMSRFSDTNFLEWDTFSENISPDNDIFIQIVSKTKKPGENVKYDDEVQLIYNEKYVIYEDDEDESLLKISLLKDDNNSLNSVFKFISKMNTYYCNNGKPVKVGSDIDRDANHNTNHNTKHRHIFRTPECFGVCKYSNGSDIRLSGNNSWILFIVFIVVVLGVILFHRLI
jgi:hypothetical protein